MASSPCVDMLAVCLLPTKRRDRWASSPRWRFEPVVCCRAVDNLTRLRIVLTTYLCTEAPSLPSPS
jgi:hypothetical protein